MIIIKSRLPPGLSANCVCGYRQWGVPRNGDCNTVRKRKKFYRELAVRERERDAGASGDGSQAGRRAGLNDCSRSCTSSCGSEMQRKIRTKARVRKQKTDRQDAQLILQLLLEDRFPKIWVPSSENRDLRQLLWHRHRMVQARTRIMNQLQSVAALNEGLRCKKRLWRQHGREQLSHSRHRSVGEPAAADLLELLDRLNPTIAELGVMRSSKRPRSVPQRSACRRIPESVPLLTALAFVLIIGQADRFDCGKQVASYLGLVPLEDSSGNRRRRGHITKQGSSMMRFLLVEAAQVTVRSVPEWRSKVSSPDDCGEEEENRQGRHGPQAGGSSLLDDAQGMGLSAVEQVRFARGTTRTS